MYHHDSWSFQLFNVDSKKIPSYHHDFSIFFPAKSCPSMASLASPAPAIGQPLHGTRHAREETHFPQQLPTPSTVEAQIVQLGTQGHHLEPTLFCTGGSNPGYSGSRLWDIKTLWLDYGYIMYNISIYILLLMVIHAYILVIIICTPKKSAILWL